MSNKLNKKSLLLSLGAVGMITLPIATVIACGDADETTTLKVTSSVTEGNLVFDMVESEIVKVQIESLTSSEFGQTKKEEAVSQAQGLKQFSGVANTLMSAEETVTTIQASKDGTAIGTKFTVSDVASALEFIMFPGTSLSTADQSAFVTELKALTNFKAFWDAIKAKDLSWVDPATVNSTEMAKLGKVEYVTGLLVGSYVLGEFNTTSVVSDIVDGQKKINAFIKGGDNELEDSDFSQKSTSTATATTLTKEDLMINVTDTDVEFTIVSVDLNADTADLANDYKIVVEASLKTAVAGTVSKKLEIIKDFTPSTATVTYTAATMGTANVSLTEDTAGTAYSITLANASDVTLADINGQFVAAQTSGTVPTINWDLTDSTGTAVTPFVTSTAIVLTYTGSYQDDSGVKARPIVITITVSAAA